MGIINDSTEKDELKGELKEEFLVKYHSTGVFFLCSTGGYSCFKVSFEITKTLKSL